MAKRGKQIQPRSGVEKAFGQVVRTIREEEIHISQAELEKRTGLNRTFISDLERGIQGPGIRTIFRIAKGLETSPDSLLRRTARSKFFEFPVGRDIALKIPLSAYICNSNIGHWQILGPVLHL